MDLNLHQYLVNTLNIELNRKIEIILEVTRCIDCLHQQNIVHLDVKPSNFLMNEDESIIKISDFGISKSKKTFDTSFTNENNLGTIGFQDPELFENGDYGTHNDIYSLGIIMYQIL
jgi:histidine kinase